MMNKLSQYKNEKMGGLEGWNIPKITTFEFIYGGMTTFFTFGFVHFLMMNSKYEFSSKNGKTKSENI